MKRCARAVRKCLIAVAAMAVLGAALVAPSAGAYSWGGNIPGNSWQSSGWVESGQTYIYAKINSGGGANKGICVGPVQHGSGGYSFPYGWDCGSVAISWSFSPITAAGGVDNDNAGEFNYGAIQS